MDSLTIGANYSPNSIGNNNYNDYSAAANTTPSASSVRNFHEVYNARGSDATNANSGVGSTNDSTGTTNAAGNNNSSTNTDQITQLLTNLIMQLLQMLQANAGDNNNTNSNQSPSASQHHNNQRNGQGCSKNIAACEA